MNCYLELNYEVWELIGLLTGPSTRYSIMIIEICSHEFPLSPGSWKCLKGMLLDYAYKKYFYFWYGLDC